MRIQLLGPVRAWVDSDPVELGSAGQRALLGLLAMAAGQPLPRPELIDALWGERPPPSAANVIQTYVKHLRRMLEPGRAARSRSAVLPHVGDGYALRVPAGAVDLLDFRRLSAAAAAAQHSGQSRAAAQHYRAALALWQGAPLLDVPLLAGHPKVVALAEERRTTQARYAELMIALGEVTDALPLLEEAAAAQPLDEAGQARLIRAYAAAGRRARAFEVFHAARRRLADELGVDPGPELVAALNEALRERPADPVPAQRHRVPAQLPADVPGFTGRAAELSALDDLGDVVVISGTAGVGKTALAVRWAQHSRSLFPDGQLYVNLRGYDAEQPMRPEEALARFLRALGMPGAEVPADTDERAAAYRSLLDGRRMLIVLDNAASADQVRPLLPGAADCRVVVTSRDLLSGLVARYGARRLDLRLLPEPDARTLLTRLIGERVAAEPEGAAGLIERCARLPLALRIAAELAAGRPGTPLVRLVAELDDEERRLELLDAGGDQETGVRAVFSWSYRQLEPAAARMFRLLGLHPGPDVEVHAAAALAGTDAAEAGRMLDRLARAHLVQRGADGRYTLHDLLRAYASELSRTDDEGDRGSALTRLLDAWSALAGTAIDTLHPAERHRLPPAPQPEADLPPIPDAAAAQTWLDAERANLAAFVVHAATHDRPEHAIRLTRTLLRHLESGGHYAEAITMHAYARRAAHQVGDAAAEAHLLTNVAVMHAQQGRYEDAAEPLRRAIELARDCGDHAAEARALGNLGHVDQAQGRYDDAAARLTEALELCRRTGDVAGEARSLGNLGLVAQRQGRLDDAAGHLLGAVRICRRIGDREGEAYALVSLGHVAARQGFPETAAARHREALGLFRKTSELAGEALALDGLGLVTADPRLVRSAVEIFRRIGERAGEARALNSLGELIHGGSAHADALALAAEIGDRAEQARAHAGLALAAEKRGESGAAEEHRHRAQRLYRTMDLA